MATATQLAVLDLDGTLIAGTAFARLVETLLASGACRREPAEQVLATIELYRQEKLDFPTTAQVAYHHYTLAVRGLTQTTVERAARTTWARARSSLYPFARPLIRLLRKADYRLLLISGSPDELVQVAAADLGVDSACGARLGIRDGRYTGVLTLETGVSDGKATALAELTKGLEIEHCNSFAIGNSVSDAALFERAGKVIVFEPDPDLVPKAHQRGWMIADRHDVLAKATTLLRHTEHHGPQR